MATAARPPLRFVLKKEPQRTDQEPVPGSIFVFTASRSTTNKGNRSGDNGTRKGAAYSAPDPQAPRTLRGGPSPWTELGSLYAPARAAALGVCRSFRFLGNGARGPHAPGEEFNTGAVFIVD